MGRVARTRPLLETVAASPGTRKDYLYGTLVNTTTFVPKLTYKSMADSVGPIEEDGPLDIISYKISDARANGSYVAGTRRDDFSSACMETSVLFRVRGNLSGAMPGVDWATYALRARTALNPNTPAVDLPVFLFELRDLPELYKFVVGTYAKMQRRMFGGRPVPPTHVTNPREAAAMNLVAQFGIIPMIQDLVKLFDFTALVKKREEYLRSLTNSNRKYTRRLDDYEYNASIINTICYQTRVNTVNIAAQAIPARRQVWFTARASATLPTAGDAPARSAALGLGGISGSSLYELIPWSWLIDYFTNVGNILAAYRGGIPFTMSPPTIMVKDSIVPSKLTLAGGLTGVSFAQPSLEFTRRQRRIQAPSPWSTLKVPYLTISQLSILGSLLIAHHPGARSITS